MLMLLEKTKPSLQTCNFENKKLMYIQGTKTRLAKKSLKNTKLEKTRIRSPKKSIPTNINLMQKFD